MITQFAFHGGVSKTEPTGIMIFHLHNKLKAGEQILKKEQEHIIQSFYGTFGQQHGASYKQAGWAADFRPFLKRFLVNERHYGWKEYYSFNRTLLRKVLGAHKVLEITELPNKN